MTVITRRFITHEPIIERTTDGPGFCCRCICGWRYQQLHPSDPPRVLNLDGSITVIPLEPQEFFVNDVPYAKSIWRDHARTELLVGGWLTWAGGVTWSS